MPTLNLRFNFFFLFVSCAFAPVFKLKSILSTFYSKWNLQPGSQLIGYHKPGDLCYSEGPRHMLIYIKSGSFGIQEQGAEQPGLGLHLHPSLLPPPHPQLPVPVFQAKLPLVSVPVFIIIPTSQDCCENNLRQSVQSAQHIQVA